MTIIGVIILLFVGLLLLIHTVDTTAKDTQCTTRHTTTSVPPAYLYSAMEYFEQGNYDYDTGDCQQAIVDYSKSIELNPSYPEAFNNRAYTYMRLRQYDKALSDLNDALALNPNYIQAHMNRGDIYNYYYAVDRTKAIADYRTVIALGGGRETSVCGHLFLAQHNGWNLGTFLDFPNKFLRDCTK